MSNVKIKEDEMSQSQLEHLNVTVADPDKTAQILTDLFGWHIRWAGDVSFGGRSVHVGSDQSYLALYSPDVSLKKGASSYRTFAGLNHIGVTVDDLDTVEAKVKALGYVPENHANYEPGRRFYFEEENGLEIEVVSYT